VLNAIGPSTPDNGQNRDLKIRTGQIKPQAPAPVAVGKPDVGASATVFFSAAAQQVAQNRFVPDRLDMARKMEDKLVGAITQAAERNTEGADMALSLVATTAIQTYATVKQVES
jgi:hypothetical protein